jgi:hypothetical protein
MIVFHWELIGSYKLELNKPKVHYFMHSIMHSLLVIHVLLLYYKMLNQSYLECM